MDSKKRQKVETTLPSSSVDEESDDESSVIEEPLSPMLSKEKMSNLHELERFTGVVVLDLDVNTMATMMAWGDSLDEALVACFDLYMEGKTLSAGDECADCLSFPCVHIFKDGKLTSSHYCGKDSKTDFWPLESYSSLGSLFLAARGAIRRNLRDFVTFEDYTRSDFPRRRLVHKKHIGGKLNLEEVKASEKFLNTEKHPGLDSWVFQRLDNLSPEDDTFCDSGEAEKEAEREREVVEEKWVGGPLLYEGIEKDNGKPTTKRAENAQRASSW